MDNLSKDKFIIFNQIQTTNYCKQNICNQTANIVAQWNEVELLEGPLKQSDAFHRKVIDSLTSHHLTVQDLKWH